MCTTPGTPQRWASASQCTKSASRHHTSAREGKAEKLRTRRSRIKNAGSMFWMLGDARRTHGLHRVADQAERCPVAPSQLVETHVHRQSKYDSPAAGHCAMLCVILATTSSAGAKAKMWQVADRALIFFSQRPTSIPEHVHPRAVSGLYLSSNHHAFGSLVQVETRQSRADETAPWR